MSCAKFLEVLLLLRLKKIMILNIFGITSIQPSTLKTILEEIQNKNSTFYFILSNKTIVGYFKLNQNDAQNELFTKPSIELERIYVLPDFQGQGIGKIALFKIIKLAQEKKVDFLWLGVWQENKSAITFYQKNGFKIFGSHPYFIGKDKQTDWLMKYQLD